MGEVIKEINSRVGAYNPETKKWQKDKSPEAQAKWYTANFSDCKL
jgi:streptogramin lyase